jgi:hypothetical protein
MKGEHLSLVTAVSATAGAIVESQYPLPVPSSIPYGQVVVGAALFLAGYFTKWDGISDVLEAFGIGYGLSALV